MTSKRNTLGSLIIWDKDSKFDIPGKESSVINSEEEFEKTKWSDFDVVYILAELGWKSRTEFYGFKVAKILRLENKLTCPIVFCSFLSKTQLSNFPESKILRRPGHYFVRLPDEKPQFERYVGIDEITLNDINIDVNNPQEELHTLMHNMLNKIPELVNSNNSIAESEKAVNDFINSRLQIFKIRGNIQSENFQKFDELKSKILFDISVLFKNINFQPDSLKEPLNDYRHLLYKLLPQNISDLQPQKVIKKRWKVLFIDDQQDTCTKVEYHFQRNGISCVSAKNAVRAFEILSEDEKTEKRISAVITDFRFYSGDEEKDIWQDYQGYRILREVHNKFSYNYAYIILTSKEGTIKDQIKKRSEFPILWFNKNDVLDGNNSSFNIFCQRIIEVGDIAFIRKHSLPSNGGWVSKVGDKVTKEFNYRSLYKLHVEDSENYDKVEFQINSKAIELSELDEMRDGYTLEPSFKNFHDNESKLLNRFRATILLYRRIFVILKYKKDKSNKEIFTFFKPQYYASGVLKNQKSRKTKSKTRADLSLSEDEIREEQREEAQNYLFHSNWGFPKKGKSNDIKVKHPENLFLDEEQRCLESIGVNTEDFNNHDDGFILMDFLDRIKELSWQADTFKSFCSIEQRLKREDDIKLNEVKILFSILKKDYESSQILKELYKKEVQRFLIDDTESSIIITLIKSSI